jgi:hypothetical protein
MDRERRTASGRIRLRGRMPDAERLRWLVDFAQQPSGPASSPTRQRLIERLAGYLREVVLRRESTGQVVLVSDLPLRGDDDQKTFADKLMLLRGTIQTLLGQHLSENERRLEAHVMLRLTVDGDGYLSKQYETDDVRDAVAYVLVLELAQIGHRVRRCAAAKCCRLFVRERRQRYCSVSCRNRSSFQQWYQRHVSLLAGTGKTAAIMIGLRRTRRQRQMKRKGRRASA